jgi:hypothetical protein
MASLKQKRDSDWFETPSALTAFFWGWEKTMWLIKADFHLDRSGADELLMVCNSLSFSIKSALLLNSY